MPSMYGTSGESPCISQGWLSCWSYSRGDTGRFSWTRGSGYGMWAVPPGPDTIIAAGLLAGTIEYA